MTLGKSSSHSQSWRFRRFSGLLLVAIYSIIVLAPLSSLAMNSSVVSHAVAGVCAGDCNICGCSLESRNTNSCCCAKKRQLSRNKLSSAKKSCCLTRNVFQAEPATTTQKRNCCQDKKTEVKNETEQNKTDQPLTVFKCGCPCGKSKLPVVAGSGSFELLPYFFSEGINSPVEDINMSSITHFMDSRHIEPPDPPPKIIVSA